MKPGVPFWQIRFESPRQPDIVALIDALDAYQDTLYPPEARYALDLDSLSQPDVLFAVVRDVRGEAQGCGAVVLSGQATEGELKRMYVRPAARGQGVARQIITLLEAEAAARGCTKICLETGPYQTEALAFYARQGYRPCGAFGEYAEHPLSVFLGKTLTSPLNTSPLNSAFADGAG